MPISAATTCNRQQQRRPIARLCGDASGFTLLELSLVLLIIVVILALVVPRLREPGRAELDAQAHRLVLVFRLLRSQAILNGAAYRLNYDLDQQRYWITPGDQTFELADFVRDFGTLARATRLQEPVVMMDVVLPTLAGKIAHGQIYTTFYPDGSIDATVIHLTNGRQAYTLYRTEAGRLRLADGYREVDYGG
jgi:prepilin-type N-terminal cleavage/methylation domain-containing protein